MAAAQGNYVYMSSGRTTDGVGFAQDVWRLDRTYGNVWQAMPQPAFGKRGYHGMVSHNDCLFVMGGQTFKGYMNDVWKSCDGAQTWESLGNAPWPARAGLAFTTFNGKIIVAGGCHKGPGIPPYGGRAFWGDVWESVDGKNWTQLTAQAEWNARSGPRLVPWNGKLLLIAGEVGFTDKTQIGDVWESADGGRTWTLLTDSPPWSRRSGHGVVVDGNRIILIAGWPELHDLWESTDGKNWTQTSNTVWGCSSEKCGQYDFWSLIHKGDLITLGGSGTKSTFGKLYSDTWVAPISNSSVSI